MFAVETNNAVTILTLSHPPVNAISEEWIRSFDAKLDALVTEPRCGVLHIRSDQKVFCAGADLREVRARMDAPDGADRMYAYVAGIQRLYARIERLPQVTVAEIGGAAMGGGLELALAAVSRIYLPKHSLPARRALRRQAIATAADTHTSWNLPGCFSTTLTRASASTSFLVVRLSLRWR